MITQKQIQSTNGEWGYICPVCHKFVANTQAWFHDGEQKHLDCINN